MKKRLLNNLKGRQGFVLVFAMLMIMLLMVFMTAMVSTVSYTNKTTAQKSDEQQLQLTAQSAIVTLKDMFAEEENMMKLSGLIGKEQEYDLTSAGITNKVKAKITATDQPNYVLLTVYAYDENGNVYTTTTLLPMVAAQGAKNDLIENMIVSYWPNPNEGLTQELSYDNNVMNGSIIIDNEYYPGAEYYVDNGLIDESKKDLYFDGTYGDKDKYQDFIVNTQINDDPYAVKIKGGTFKELVTTGNLRLNAEQTIKGLANTTIASAVGQLAVTKGTIGDGSGAIKQIGAGGYFERKLGEDDAKVGDKTGNILINNQDSVEFKDPVNIISRDRVNVNLNGIKGVLKNCFIGGKLTYKSANGSMNVQEDIQVYKSADYNIQNGADITVGGDMASGLKSTVNIASGANVNVNGAVATATEDLKVAGQGTLKADYLLSGKGLDVSAPTTLTGSKGYAAFSGGNYGVGGTNYLSKGENDRGTTKLSNITTSKPVVINNKQDSTGGLTVKDKNSDVSAFKTMNSIWLSKAEKVYKGGWWSECTKIQFAVALLFDPDAVDSSLKGRFQEYASKAADASNMRTTAYISNANLRYNPNGATVSRDANWQWYEKSNEKYNNNSQKLPVSHELGYTVNDSIFLLRSTLQKALGGPTDSTDLRVNALAQGEFVDIARTAIPYDGAIEKIAVNYPHYGNYENAPTVDSETAGWASVTEYKDGYLIGGNSSTTGYANFGRVDVREGGNKLFDGANFYDISGRTLYFKSTSPIIPGGWGDFFITSNEEVIRLNNKIVIEYTLNGTDESSISHLGYIRWFVDPAKSLELSGNFTIEGVNNGSVNANSAEFSYNGFDYKGISPEFYIFCPKPNQEAKVSINIQRAGFKGFIIAPWSVINTRTISASKDTEVFRGVILCKNFVRADGGTYNHYKPISFGYAMSDAVFVLPDSEGNASE